MKEYEQTDSITGNELEGDEIAEFSKKLDVNVLVDYCKAVMDSTDELLLRLTYADLKRKFTEEDKNRIIDSLSAFLSVFLCAGALRIRIICFGITKNDKLELCTRISTYRRPAMKSQE